MDLNLSTSSKGGSISSTGSPQAITQSNLSGATSSSLQSIDASNLLTSNTGIALGNSSSSTLNVSTGSSGTTSTVGSNQHHASGVLIGIVVAVFIVAIALFWRTFNSANNTTY
jgi:hypothetical protein